MKSLLDLERRIDAADALAASSADVSESDNAGDEAARLRAVAMKTRATCLMELAAKIRIFEKAWDHPASIGDFGDWFLSDLATVRADVERLVAA